MHVLNVTFLRVVQMFKRNLRTTFKFLVDTGEFHHLDNQLGMI